MSYVWDIYSRSSAYYSTNCLIDIGYHRDLLHNGYTFADVFAPNQPLRYVDLAVDMLPFWLQL